MDTKFEFPAKEVFLTWLAARSDEETYGFQSRVDCLLARFLKDVYPSCEILVHGTFCRINDNRINFPLWLRSNGPEDYHSPEDDYLQSGSMKTIKGYFLKREIPA